MILRTILLTIVGFFLTLGGVLALVFLLAYRFSPDETEEFEVTGLSSSVEVQWSDDQIPTIRAATETDALAALGYTHALKHAWGIALWRQTALGRLSEWYGDSTVVFDEFSRTLGFAGTARKAYERLELPDQVALEAYSRGINAVFGQHPSKFPRDLLLSGISPEPWEPWHSLALERLFSWMASDPRVIPDDQGPALSAFLSANEKLHAFLQVHGFDQGMAWAARAPTDTYFFQRHTTGSSAIPLIQSAVIQTERSASTIGAIPGTIALPWGQNEAFGWHVSMVGSWTIQPGPEVDSERLPIYERYINNKEDEFLVSYFRTGRSLTLPETIVRSDSTLNFSWEISWSGFGSDSDWPAWHAFLQQNNAGARFQIISGNGLLVRREGSWTVLGNPKIQRSLPNGILVADTPWAIPVSNRLETVLRSYRNMDLLLMNHDGYYSRWASELAPPLVRTVASMKDNSVVIEDALKYLSNWDHTFQDASIGASLFDSWMAEFKSVSGESLLPDTSAVVPDSVSLARRRVQLRSSLDTAIRSIRRKLGPDMSRWRWESVQPDSCRFPVWNDPRLTGQGNRIPNQRFSVFSVAAGGHPTGLFWRASNLTGFPASTAVLESWTHTGAWNLNHVLFADLRNDEFMDRYLRSSARKRVSIDRTATTGDSVTLLVP